jgi:hypothetical protein
MVYLRHYTVRLRQSRRLRYRIARSLVCFGTAIALLVFAIALARH